MKGLTGPVREGRGWRFVIWSPNPKKIELVLPETKRSIPMPEPDEHGYREVFVPELQPGTLYHYSLDGHPPFPDPASRFQPQGVHGPSALVAPEFDWQDHAWFGLPLRDYAICELHVGTFTAEGSFEAIIPHLPRLRDLGITAIELMPIAQFPGARNWGYDGVLPFAAQNSYGGPEGLKRLVNAAHQNGLAVVLDVVYNHLGPEGNYLGRYGKYFADRYRTPWGAAINFDGPGSDQVRRYFIDNALYWQTECHIDALRLDAVHAIFDTSAVPFLQQLADETHRQTERLNRRFHLIAESDLNDVRVILPPALNGLGLDAQWSDDFHHSLRVLLTGDKTGYYGDFGGAEIFARALREGYAYIDHYSRHRGRRHGNSPRLAEPKRFVVYSANHDQVGNRMTGDRLASHVSFEDLKLAACCVILSPFTPMLFMGDEYGETAPFQYFVSHSDEQLVAAVRKGRREEFPDFHKSGAEVPDPQSPATFERSKLNHALREAGRHKVLEDFHRELFRLRREVEALTDAGKQRTEVVGMPGSETVCARYWTNSEEIATVFCFCKEKITAPLPLPAGEWTILLQSADQRWNGPVKMRTDLVVSGGKLALPMPPRSCTLLRRSA